MKRISYYIFKSQIRPTFSNNKVVVFCATHLVVDGEPSLNYFLLCYKGINTGS